MKSRLGITVDEEVYLDIVKNGLTKDQQLSKTINMLLKIYFDNYTKYEKTISELKEEIEKLRLKHYTEVVRDTKDLLDEEKKQKQKEIRQRQIADSIKATGMLEDAF